jgi:hypothetical protein
MVALRGIGDHRVPAIRKPFEPHQMLRQCRRDIRLALDWVNGIVLATEHQGRTLDAVEIAEHIEGVALAARSRKPLQDLRPVDGMPRHVLAPLRQIPAVSRAVLAAAIAAVVEIDDLGNIGQGRRPAGRSSGRNPDRGEASARLVFPA